MNEKEIKGYFKRVDELGAKLTGEDKETYTWLIYGCNQCAKLLNKTEQQCKKQKEVIDKIQKIINTEIKLMGYAVNDSCLMLIQDILKEVSE